MTGWGIARIACGSAAMASWKRSRSMAGARGVEHAGPEVAHVDAGAEAAAGAGQHNGVHVRVGTEGGAGLHQLGRA